MYFMMDTMIQMIVMKEAQDAAHRRAEKAAEEAAEHARRNDADVIDVEARFIDEVPLLTAPVEGK